MPVINSVGHSANTHNKQYGVGNVTATLMAACAAECPHFNIVDMNAGPGVVAGLQGSPLVFAREAEKAFPNRYTLYAVERNAVNLQKLIGHFDTLNLTGVPIPVLGENAKRLPSLAKKLTDQWGLVYCDPCGTDIPFEMLGQLFGNKPGYHIDLLLNCAKKSFKRAQVLAPNLADLIPAVNKKFIFATPSSKDNFEWTFIFATDRPNWTMFAKLQELGFTLIEDMRTFNTHTPATSTAHRGTPSKDGWWARALHQIKRHPKATASDLAVLVGVSEAQAETFLKVRAGQAARAVEVTTKETKLKAKATNQALSDEEVLALRKDYAAGMLYGDLSKKYNRFRNSVDAIVHGRTYKHLPVFRRSKEVEHAIRSRARQSTGKNKQAVKEEVTPTVRKVNVPNRALTDEQAMAVRKSFAEGVQQTQLAAKYKMSVNGIANVVRGRAYRHLPLIPRPDSLRVPLVTKVRPKTSGTKLNDRFTDEQIVSMRKKRAAGSSYPAIAREFGTQYSSVRSICMGINYSHVRGGPLETKPISESDKKLMAKVCKLKALGLNNTVIARKLNVARAETVRQLIMLATKNKKGS
jgi:Mor family transcriptional regulator